MSDEASGRHRRRFLPSRRARTVLPVNSDIEIARTVVGVPVIILLRPSYLGLAALGGAFGAAARYGLTLAAPRWGNLSTAAVIANVLGPLMLGMLLQLLSHREESVRTRAVRLVVAVGFLGAFTSYAQLALDAVLLFREGLPAVAVIYTLGTLIAGVSAAWLGVVIVRRLGDRRGRGRSSPA